MTQRQTPRARKKLPSRSLGLDIASNILGWVGALPSKQRIHAIGISLVVGTLVAIGIAGTMRGNDLKAQVAQDSATTKRLVSESERSNAMSARMILNYPHLAAPAPAPAPAP